MSQLQPMSKALEPQQALLARFYELMCGRHAKKNQTYHKWYEKTAQTFCQSFTFIALLMLFFAFWASWDFKDYGGIARRLFFADGLLMGKAKKHLALTTFWNGHLPTTILATLFRLKHSRRNHWSLLSHFLGVVTLWKSKYSWREMDIGFGLRGRGNHWSWLWHFLGVVTLWRSTCRRSNLRSLLCTLAGSFFVTLWRSTCRRSNLRSLLCTLAGSFFWQVKLQTKPLPTLKSNLLHVFFVHQLHIFNCLIAIAKELWMPFLQVGQFQKLHQVGGLSRCSNTLWLRLGGTGGHDARGLGWKLWTKISCKPILCNKKCPGFHESSTLTGRH